MIRYCTICRNPAPFLLKKGYTDYHQCESCKTIFSEMLDQEGLVGGQHEEGRNITQNHIRLDRVATMMEGMKKEDFWILDFGCGHGMLVNDLKNDGYNVVGFDPYNPEFSRLPEKNKFHLVICVECIEHLSSPFLEIDVINRSMVNGGLLYLETGFYNIMIEDGLKPEEYIYISPEAGHSTIFSHHSLDLLLAYRGFGTRRHFDRNCRLFEKIKTV